MLATVSQSQTKDLVHIADFLGHHLDEIEIKAINYGLFKSTI